MNVASSRIDVFFYGLFMDEELLRSKGANPTEVRQASVRNLSLQIGARAVRNSDRQEWSRGGGAPRRPRRIMAGA